MSSLCITRSISIDSQDGYYSPTVDLGKDFEYLIRKCIAEKMARELEMTDAFGTDQSEATALCDVASLDMPLDTEKEHETEPTKTTLDAETCEEEENNNVKTTEEKTCLDCISQHSENVCNDGEKVREEKLDKVREGKLDTEIEMKSILPEDKENEAAAAVELASNSLPDQEENDSYLPLFADFEFPPLIKEQTPPKRKVRECVDATTAVLKKKPAKKRKWKPIGQENVAFEMSLLPRRAEVPLTDCDVIYEMQGELKKFEKELSELKDSNVQECASDCDTKEQTDKVPRELFSDPVLVEDSLQIDERNDSRTDTYDQGTNEAFYEDKVPNKYLFRLEQFRDNRACKHVRRKHKWKHQKARKAIKTKKYNTKNVVNRAHGQKLYINHRLVNYNVLGFFGGNYLPGRKKCDIDGKGFIFKEYGGGRTIRQYNGTRNYKAPAPVRNYQIAQPVPAYALRANNADTDLENDLINILMNVQNRDLTPEDYELLLRLDERVAPKTLDQDILDGFKTDVVTESELAEECTVCMEAYQIGQQRKHLPCGHVFHKNCIDTWLKNSSMNCPLDGLSVE